MGCKPKAARAKYRVEVRKGWKNNNAEEVARIFKKHLYYESALGYVFHFTNKREANNLIAFCKVRDVKASKIKENIWGRG